MQSSVQSSVHGLPLSSSAKLTKPTKCQNSYEDQIEENLATYVGGRDPSCSIPELGPI